MNTPIKVSRTLMLLLVASALCLNSKGQSWSGGHIGTSQNWSDGLNWVGGAAPTSGSAVLFPDGAYPVTTNVQGAVNNIVQSSTTVSSLTYNNNGTANDFVTTSIQSGNTLTVSGNISAGGSVATT